MIEWRNDILKAAGLWPPPPEDVAYMGFKFWSNKLNLFIINCWSGDNVVFDPKKQKVVGKFKGHIIGTNAEGTLVAIHPTRSDNPRGTDNSKIEVINLLDLIQPKPGP